MKTTNINKVKYMCFPYYRKNTSKVSIKPIGLDTEAYPSGECFMLATSEGDIFKIDYYPRCLFNRKYRGKSFVCYNLKYDSGAMLQHLSPANLEELRTTDKTCYRNYTYQVIANKCFTIRKGKNSIHIYDMLNFYNMALDKAARLYIDMQKKGSDPALFTHKYVSENWSRIGEYCLQDANLVERLSHFIIKRFESYGVYPKKLYSIAYISYLHFRAHCPNVIVKKYWEKHKEVLSFALQAYNGGKFEVTTKGPGYYYEYDIVSAYPFEIRNLVDISWARVVREKAYRKNAIYGFLKCKIRIPMEVYSPVAVKRNNVNCYAVGAFEKVITKCEYEYLVGAGCDIEILDAYYLCCYNKQYPYRKEIDRLVKLKSEYKLRGMDLDYHTVKIIMNSFYGKFVQLIEKQDYYEAGSRWHPIDGSVITANTRIKMSDTQKKHNSVCAVHTDSVLSTSALSIQSNESLGDFILKAQGQGVILGSGIYQIGNKTKFRGMSGQLRLMEILSGCGKELKLSYKHAYTWREVAHRGWYNEKINLFENIPKQINVNFDQKRLWLNDWQDWTQVLERKVESLPLISPSPM